MDYQTDLQFQLHCKVNVGFITNNMLGLQFRKGNTWLFVILTIFIRYKHPVSEWRSIIIGVF